MQNKYLKFLLIALIVAIAIPQITLAAWWNPFSWGVWNKIFHSQTQQQKLIGGDKDSHGCLIAAGYTWCEVKNKCLRTWEEKCEKVSCPQFSPPAPNFCSGGKIISGGVDANGCQLPPKCDLTTNQTASWKTYTNTQYGFEIKYPSDWKITDKSMTDANTNIKYPAINIESPFRSDLMGYQGIPVSYRILIYRPEKTIVSIADFGSNQKPAQSWWNLSVGKAVKEATPEYKIGEQIISTFKFTK